jgi:hypothetical protein
MAKRDIEKEIHNFFQKKNVSLAWRKPYEDVWERNKNYLKTKFFPELEKSDYLEKICVNMVHPHVRVVVPAIYSKNPDILVNPRRKDEELFELLSKRAATFQKVLKYYIKELDLKSEFKLSILDGVLAGHAWMKVGYETQFENLDLEDNSTIIDKMLTKIGLQPKEEDEHLFTNVKITSENPWALRTSYKDIVVPALSRRDSELGWIAERFILPYEEVMENPDFDTKGLKPNANANNLLAKIRGASYDPKNLPDGNKEEYVIFWEVWKRKDKTVCVIAEDHYENYLQEKESAYTYLDSKFHPYFMLRFNEIPDEFYPDSDITPAEPQMLELNETRTQMINHTRRFNRKYAAKPGALTPEAKTALREGEDGVIIEVSEQYSEDPVTSTIMPIIDAPLPPEVFAVESRVKDDIFTILGTQDYASQSSGGARSATEAQIIAAQSRFRVEERIDLIGEFAGKVIKAVGQICLKNIDKEKAMQILGLEGVYWRQYNDDEDIRGEFEYDVIYGSTTPVSKEIEREQYFQFFSMANGNPIFNQLKISLELANRFRDYLMDDPETYLEPKIAKMLQIQLVQAIMAGEVGPQGSTNGTGSNSAPGRVPDPGKRKQGNLRERQASGGMSGSKPRTPGGKGGTAAKTY